jgi:hypothetical protein
MQFAEAQRLRNAYKNKKEKCTHPELDLEYFLGSSTDKDRDIIFLFYQQPPVSRTLLKIMAPDILPLMKLNIYLLVSDTLLIPAQTPPRGMVKKSWCHAVYCHDSLAERCLLKGVTTLQDALLFLTI